MVEEPSISQVDLHIERIPNTPVTSNCFVLHEVDSNDCLLIDPGSDDNDALLDYLQKNQLCPSNVILTHEHFDHIWGVVGLSENFQFKLVCNEVCATAIRYPKKNLSLFHDQVGFSILKDVTTAESLQHELNWNEKKLKLIQTPGHSEGSISIQLDDMLFVGDLLIQNEKTVTKLPGGSVTKLKESFSKLKADFSTKTLINSGHGESFSFGNYFHYHKL